MKLVIVESPPKARTIQKFLSSEYMVLSSKGHIRDLPPREFGVDIKNGFKPTYKILKDKQKVVKGLKEKSKDANLIILATDPDREGEAIAYHILYVIGKPAKRALLYEITKEAVNDAIRNPEELNMAKVDAQQARRILDRLVGYEVSPLLWSVFKQRNLSAGRVQSVALRLVCEREKEIREFVPEEYWEINCRLNLKSQISNLKSFIVAKLIKIDEEKAKITNEKEATKIESELKNEEFIVENFKKEEKKKMPSPPYITSTLQQDASIRLRFSTKKTMQIAQQLFEEGYITYMRTDSVRIAPKALDNIRKYINKILGREYLPDKPHFYKEKKTAQAAHEAIRPTSVEKVPDKIKQDLTPDQFRIYSLIWRRTLASQISSALIEIRNLDIKAGKFLLRASGKKTIFSGFMAIYKIEQEKTSEVITSQEIPEIEKGTFLNLLEVIKDQHFTKPRLRYTEGTMVKELEANGIGRPSTYAPTISRIIEKEYVTKENGKLLATDLGEAINTVLVARFPDIFNVDFTREMEENLDKIELEKLNWKMLLHNFYGPFKKDVIKFQEEREEVKTLMEEKSNEICEKCGKPMVIKLGKYGKFLACTGFPECKNTRPVDSDVKTAPEKTGETCPKCGSPLVVKKGRYGQFIGCSNYPKCNFIKPKSIGIKCPECGSELVEKKTKKGKIFYGCSNYPECKFAIWDKPISKKCSSCGNPFMVEKKGTLVCPKCGSTP